MGDIGEAFVDGLRPWWPPKFNEIGAPAVVGVDVWLAKGGYACTGYLPAIPAANGVVAVKQKLTIHVSSPKDLSGAFAAEVARFSSAAYESLLDSDPPSLAPKSLGWCFVRHYYAAFYCAHALIRSFGLSMTFISHKTAGELNRLGGLSLGVAPAMGKGIHLVEFDRTNPAIVHITKWSSASGGSHEDLWVFLLDFLRGAEDQILLHLGAGDPAGAKAISLLQDLRARFQGGGWASGLRNDVNYKHGFDLWFPWVKKKGAVVELAERMRRWSPDYKDGLSFAASRDDLIKFADVCNVLTHLMTAVLRDVSRRSILEKGGFVDKAPFKLLRSRFKKFK